MINFRILIPFIFFVVMISAISFCYTLRDVHPNKMVSVVEVENWTLNYFQYFDFHAEVVLDDPSARVTLQKFPMYYGRRFEKYALVLGKNNYAEISYLNLYGQESLSLLLINIDHTNYRIILKGVETKCRIHELCKIPNDSAELVIKEIYFPPGEIIDFVIMPKSQAFVSLNQRVTISRLIGTTNNLEIVVDDAPYGNLKHANQFIIQNYITHMKRRLRQYIFNNALEEMELFLPSLGEKRKNETERGFEHPE